MIRGSKGLRSFVAGCLLSVLFCLPAIAQEKEKPRTGLTLAGGLTFANGILDVSDEIIDPIEDLGFDVENLTIPVGFTFVGGYRFESGVMILGDFGPISIITLDVDGGTLDGTHTYWNVPVGLTAGYAFFTDRSVSPYARGGFRYNFGGGDFREGSKAGPYIAAGVNFLNDAPVKLQLELAYDASEVTLENINRIEEDVSPSGFMVSIRVAF